MPITHVVIPGIHCPSCTAIIEDISSEFPAITKVDVDLEKKTVILEHSEDFDLAAWKQEIEALGETYKVHTT